MSEPNSWIDEEGNTHYGIKPKNAKEIIQKNIIGPKIKFSIDSTKEFKDLQEENTDLKAKLITVAEKEFDRQVDKAIEEGERLGLDVHFISNPEELRYVQKQIKEKKVNKNSSREIPLTSRQLGFQNPQNQGLPLEERSYSNLEELFNDLEKEHREGNPKAKKVLGELTRKSAEDLVKGSEYQFEGRITKANKDPREKLKWKKIR